MSGLNGNSWNHLELAQATPESTTHQEQGSLNQLSTQTTGVETQQGSLEQTGKTGAAGEAKAAETGAPAGEAKTGHAAEGEAGGHEVCEESIPELQNAIDYILAKHYINVKEPLKIAVKEKNGETKVEEHPYQCKEKTSGEMIANLHTIHITPVIGRPGDIMNLTWLDVMNCSYGFLTVFILIAIAARVKSKLKKIPHGFQGIVELFVVWMRDYFEAILGKKLNRQFLPFVGSIFLYVLFMNYLGMVPLMKAPVALNLNTPLSVAICVFLLVQFQGVRVNGALNYLKHFTGDPTGMWPLDCILMPLNFVLHLIGEFSKPISLSLRLFGNITGEDVVVAALVALAVGGSFFPWQSLFYPLGILFSFIQALVFATLSSVYILTMSGHSHEEHH